MDTRFPSLIIGSLSLLGPAAALAAGGEMVLEEDLVDPIEIMEALPVSEGRGGGGGADFSYVPYPGYGIMVDATVMKEVTPDFIALNTYCDIGRSDTREAALQRAEAVYESIKAAVGSDGVVRKNGSFSVYPFYLAEGRTDGYSANINVYVRVSKPSAASRIADAVEKEGCGMNWDVRLTDTQSYELGILDELAGKAAKRKQVFETLLKKKLTTIISASLNTWLDGYSSYDPAKNRADATTTLNMTYALEGSALTPVPTPKPFERLESSTDGGSALRTRAEQRRRMRLAQ